MATAERSKPGSNMVVSPFEKANSSLFETTSENYHSSVEVEYTYALICKRALVIRII